MHSEYTFDPYPLTVTMKRMADNLKARRLEKKLSTKSLSAMSGVPASTIQRFELKHSISLESYVKLAKALGYTEEVMQLLSEPKYDTMKELLEINKNKTAVHDSRFVNSELTSCTFSLHLAPSCSI